MPLTRVVDEDEVGADDALLRPTNALRHSVAGGNLGDAPTMPVAGIVVVSLFHHC